MNINNHIKVTSPKKNKGSSDTFYLGFIFILIIGGGYYIYDDMQKNAQLSPTSNDMAVGTTTNTATSKSDTVSVIPAAIVKAPEENITNPEKPETNANKEIISEPVKDKIETTSTTEAKPVEKSAPKATEKPAEKVEEVVTETKQETPAPVVAKLEEKVEPKADSKVEKSTPVTATSEVAAKESSVVEPVSAPKVVVEEKSQQELPTPKENQVSAVSEPIDNRHPMYSQPGFMPPPQAFVPPRARMYMPEPNFREFNNAPENYMPRPYYNNRNYSNERQYGSQQYNAPQYNQRAYRDRGNYRQNPYYGY